MSPYKQALDKWGWTAQLDQLQEECGETIVAVNHLKRASIDV
jgi:hypothetical protein